MAKLQLSSLAAASQIAVKQQADTELSLDLIDVLPQVRTEFEGIAELSANIDVHGILAPLIVHAEEGGRYRLICGERRYRAARVSGLTSAPVRIKRGLSEEEIRALQVAENGDTNPLNPLDEVNGVMQDIAHYGATGAAKIWNRAPGWISKRASFKNFSPDVQELMIKGRCKDLEILGSIHQLTKLQGGETHAKSAIAKINRGETLSRDGVRELVARVKAYEKGSVPKEKVASSDAPGLVTGNRQAAATEKKLNSLREQLHQDGQRLHGQIKRERLLIADSGQPLESEEWLLWSSFKTVMLPVLDALSDDLANAFLRRLSVELKSSTPEKLYIELHGGDAIGSSTDPVPEMDRDWKL